MKQLGYWCAALVLVQGAALRAETPAATPLPLFQKTTSEAKATIVLYNSADPASLDLAGYYAEKRGIPFDHLIGLRCSLNEEISREEYDRTIAGPLRKTFDEREWWRPPRDGASPVRENKIRFVVLMRGVPLKVAQTTDYPGDSYDGLPVLNRNDASVDSEIAALGFFSRKISGPMKNPYYRSFAEIFDANLAPLMLVCRLDAPSAQRVRGMIDDSIAAERHGLFGFAYIDMRGLTTGGLAEGDKWLERVADNARRHGIPVIADSAPAQFPNDFPMRNAAFYFGWYADTVSGPVAQKNFRFNRGAIACHIHSFSAASLRNPQQQWVAPLIEHGAAAAFGNVYEPYLSLTANLDVFYDRLQNGFNFAESAYTSIKVLSWMSTFVGDPLYRPFQVVPEDAGEPAAADWIAYRKGAVKWFNESRSAGETELQQHGDALKSGIIFEGLGLLEHDVARDSPAAAASFERAAQFYTNAGDKIRIALARAQSLREASRAPEAIAVLQKAIKTFPSEAATNVLRARRDELLPKPAGTPTP